MLKLRYSLGLATVIAITALHPVTEAGPDTAQLETDAILENNPVTTPENIPYGCGPLAPAYDGYAEKSANCPLFGMCDNRQLRDLWSYNGTELTTWVKLYFHVFRDNDGNNAVCTEQDVANQVAQLNIDMLEYGFQFTYEMAFRDSSIFRYNLAFSQFDPMKSAFNVKPDSQCNIYVADVNDPQIGQFSYQTFPWENDAVGSTGGIVMNTFQFTPFDGRHTMTHEIGHNLGLHHVFHGYEENYVQHPCSFQCAENTGTGALHTSGDYCADTPPQPIVLDCGPPGSIDQCTGLPWGSFPNTNYMNYSATCKEEFTPQQTARMHCWTHDVLRGWVINPRIDVDTVFGQAPLSVTFDGSFRYNADEWQWDFGDGDSASGSSASHTYSQPGLRNVSLQVLSDSGNFTTVEKAAIWVYADSLIPRSSEAFPGESMSIDIYAKNSLPIGEMLVPFTWSGSLGLTFDSVSTSGLRTQDFEPPQVINLDPANNRGTVRIHPALGEPYLSSDTGSVLTIFFTLDSSAAETDTAEVTIQAYSIFNPRFTTIPGTYQPRGLSGQMTIAACNKGDINGGDDGIDVSDLTYLVAFMFNNGPAPPITEYADIDSNGSIDIADLTQLVAFMFNGGPAPVCK